jgi:hypothetical protein
MQADSMYAQTPPLPGYPPLPSQSDAHAYSASAYATAHGWQDSRNSHFNRGRGGQRPRHQHQQHFRGANRGHNFDGDRARFGERSNRSLLIPAMFTNPWASIEAQLGLAVVTPAIAITLRSAQSVTISSNESSIGAAADSVSHSSAAAHAETVREVDDSLGTARSAEEDQCSSSEAMPV